MNSLLPAETLPDLARRFGGIDRLYGSAGAQQIRDAHVAVVGIGGVGSWTAEALARSGVGRLTLIDLDHIAESNINRQVHAVSNTLGQAKVQAMRERIAGINPLCDVRCIEEFAGPDNWPGLLCEPPDAVVDACDQLKAKLAIGAWALQREQRRTVFITVGAAGGKRLAHQVDIDDLAAVTHDPLLAQLRYRLRKTEVVRRQQKKIGLTCVFSREAVQHPVSLGEGQNGDGSLSCHGYGSMVSVTATFGQCAAGWVVDQLAQRRLEN